MSAANSQPPHIEDDEAELLALRAALAEAEAGGPSIPHAVMRERLMEMMDLAEQRALAAAVTEAEAGGPSIPHEAVEAEMQMTLDRLVLKVAKLAGEA